MTRQEHTSLSDLLNGDRSTLHTRLSAYLDTAHIKEYDETRSIQQNKAMHVWFDQVAEVCRDAGIDAKLIMAQTVSVEMNADIVKGMWRVMQEALYGTKSTTEVKRSQQIEHIVDHFIRFFGEKFGLELPPFPSKETLYVTGTKIPYPDYESAPTI